MEDKRIPPREMATKITKLLKKERPDHHYLKRVFQYVREDLDLKGTVREYKRLPELLTEEELKKFYQTVWEGGNGKHILMIKLLIYTGMRNSELANLTLKDIDLNAGKIRIDQGKGKKDRYVLVPEFFKGELAQYIDAQSKLRVTYLFETRRLDKPSTRLIRKIVKQYADKAGIEKRIYPHLFRHQLLTYLTAQGIVDAKLQLISGHADKDSLQVYQKLSLKDVEAEYQDVIKGYIH